MNLGDFSSVVQLGVGLHAGSALLESAVDLGGTPLTRRLSRLARIAEARAKRDTKHASNHDTALDLLGDLEVKKVQFFNEYQVVLQINTAVAIGLAIVLVWIAFAAQDPAPVWAGIFFCVLSLLPAPGSWLFLWSRWKAATDELNTAVFALEKKLLPTSAP